MVGVDLVPVKLTRALEEGGEWLAFGIEFCGEVWKRRKVLKGGCR